MIIILKENWTMPKRQKTFEAGTKLEVLPWLRNELVEKGIAEDHELTRQEKKELKKTYKNIK